MDRHLNLPQLCLRVSRGVFLEDMLAIKAVYVGTDQLEAVKLMLRLFTCSLEVGKASLGEEVVDVLLLGT